MARAAEKGPMYLWMSGTVMRLKRRGAGVVDALDERDVMRRAAPTGSEA